MIEISKITTDAGFLRLRERWNSLLSQSSNNTIFLTWEWLYSWWEIFKDNRKLFILIAKENKEIVGIAPLLRRRVYYFKILPFYRLEFLASGEDAKDETCSIYLNFIIKNGRERAVIDAFVNYFKINRDKWDEINLGEIIKDKDNLILLQKFTDDKMFYKTDRYGKCAYVNSPDSWEKYLANLGRLKRRNIRRDRKLLSKKFEVKYDVVDFDKIEDLLSVLEPMKKIHQREWKSRGRLGVFASNKFTKFIEIVSKQLAKKKWLKLSYLKLDNKEVAFHYTFNYNNKIYDYITGFTPVPGKNIGVGTVLLSYCIENMINSNVKEWDFLKSGECGWKHEWANSERMLVSARISKKNLKERCYLALVFSREMGRKLKRKIVKK
jgi:CelD/BcsL family acetyltransferase involved in cellulose biosynthesis